MFKHKKTKKVRDSGRSADDLIAHSCHVIIKLEADRDTPPTYRVAVEETPGISTTYIKSFFRQVLKAAPYTSNDKRGQEIEATCIPDFQGHPSESVEDALHEGVIRQVHLVKPGEITEFDGEHIEVKSIVQQLKIKGRGKAVMSAITDLWDRNKNDWSEMRVQIESAEKKSRIVHIEREEEAAQVLYVKSELVFLKRKIDACCESVHDELVGKAKAILGL